MRYGAAYGMTNLILVGGFLGAGKTTLILKAAEILQSRGVRTAVITNDQGENLVDTERVRAAGFDAAEIGGGCFCCQFSALVDALDRVMSVEPAVIFAEPVGSCTDIAATVLRPLQELHSDRVTLAPYTVLIDPTASIADGDLQYLFDTQIREADLLCYTKADLCSEFPAVGGDEPLRVSAATGEGVARWLDVLFAWSGAAGARVIDVDYDRYAAAEASLGWLNASIQIEMQTAASPASVIGPLLDSLDQRLTVGGAAIAHLKLFDQTASSYLKAGIVANGGEPSVEGDTLAPAELHHHVVINLRAVAAPECLREMVEAALEDQAGRITIDQMAAFAPAYPKPERRTGPASPL